MPRSRGPGKLNGQCPRCGGNLISSVTLQGGRYERCPACGFARIGTTVSTLLMPAQDEAEPSGPQDTLQLLVYAQAVLQTVHQAQGCKRCQERLAFLRTQINDLELEQAAYARHPEQCDDGCLDAFFERMLERLQDIEGLCRSCRSRMEGITWELFVTFLLEAQKTET